RMKAQTSSTPRAKQTADPTIRTGSQLASISPTRRAIRAGGSPHSTGSKTTGTYQRQPLIRDSVGDGLSLRRSSASAATTGPTANKASDDSRIASVIG